MRKSFDVFDTLVARRLSSDELIDILASDHYNDEHFTRDRKAADNGKRTLGEIYQHMLEQGQISQPTISYTVESLVANECQLERNNLYPIKENMDRVEDGDILVSDMYIPGPEILEMVRHCGLTKQVTIYQSNADKATGAFWKGLKDAGVKLEYHIGDNVRSDFDHPMEQGYRAINFDKYKQSSDIELYLMAKKLPSLARLIREVTATAHNPHPALFQIAAQVNLPWLFVTCEMISRKNRIHTRPLTFLGRDCQLMYRIWDAYFDNWRSGKGYYLPFSRKVALENPETASAYLKTQAPRFSQFIDISSTGRTWEKLANAGYGRFEILVAIHSDQFSYSATKPVLPSTFQSLTTNSQVGPSNILLEIFNCGDHGRLDKIQMVNGLPLVTFAEPELDKRLVWSIHYPIHKAVELRPEHYNIVDELSDINDDELMTIFKDLKNTICAQTRLLELLKHDYVVKDEAYTQECRSL